MIVQKNCFCGGGWWMDWLWQIFFETFNVWLFQHKQTCGNLTTWQGFFFYFSIFLFFLAYYWVLESVLHPMLHFTYNISTKRALHMKRMNEPVLPNTVLTHSPHATQEGRCDCLIRQWKNWQPSPEKSEFNMYRISSAALNNNENCLTNHTDQTNLYSHRHWQTCG
jgi:hypothetical protein